MIREIFIKKNWPIQPIHWVYGTNGLQIGFDILDFDLATVSSVKFYSLTASGARYEATGTKNGSTVSFKPVSGFFAVGCNKLQCELVATSGTVYSFAVSVYCEENNKFEGAEQDPIALANYIEQINKNTQDITDLKERLEQSGASPEDIQNAVNNYLASHPVSGVTVDSDISSTSENPVQNKVIASELSEHLTMINTAIQNSERAMPYFIYYGQETDAEAVLEIAQSGRIVCVVDWDNFEFGWMSHVDMVNFELVLDNAKSVYRLSLSNNEWIKEAKGSQPSGSKEIISEKEIEVSIWKTGNVIASDGSVAYNAKYVTSSPISLKAGQTLTWSCVVPSTMSALTVDKGNISSSLAPYDVLVTGAASDMRDYIYTASDDVSVVIAYKTEYGITAKVRETVYVNVGENEEKNKSIRVEKDSSDQFSVYVAYDNGTELCHVFTRKVVTNNKTTTGVTKKIMDCWYPSAIYDDNGHHIMQGNGNFIHRGSINGVATAISGCGDGSCVTTHMVCRMDGIAFDPMELIDPLRGNSFEFVAENEHYVCTGTGVYSNADYKTETDSNGNFTLESIEYLHMVYMRNNHIRLRNKLLIKQDSMQFEECYGGMCAGYHPHFTDVIINDTDGTSNRYALSNGTWTEEKINGSSDSIKYRFIDADSVMMLGDGYKVVQTMTQNDRSRSDKTRLYEKLYTDGRIKMYFMPCLKTETFNNGDMLDVTVDRKIETYTGSKDVQYMQFD